MYRIALCEDEALFSKDLEVMCRSILDHLAVDYEMNLFNSSKDFLHAFLDKGKRFDLMLLDIVMAEPNGMDLAHLIRKDDSDGAIIFITSNPDFALLGYDVQALHYLIKPAKQDVLERLIKADYNNRFQTNFYIFETGTQMVRVAVQEIVCLETVGRKVEVTLQSGVVYYNGKLSELLEELPNEQFVRCHQAFALNIKNIQELNYNEAITCTGKSISVSRTYTKDVQHAFAKHLRDL